VAHWVR